MASGGYREQGGALAEINVTPLVDVMLVLLIIFMVSAPILHRGIEVGLPQAVTGEVIDEERVMVTVDDRGQFFVDDEPVIDRLLVEEVRQRGGGSPNMAVYLRGDAKVPYGRVLGAMDALRQAGITRVALIIEPAAGAPVH